MIFSVDHRNNRHSIKVQKHKQKNSTCVNKMCNRNAALHTRTHANYGPHIGCSSIYLHAAKHMIATMRQVIAQPKIKPACHDPYDAGYACVLAYTHAHSVNVAVGSLRTRVQQLAATWFNEIVFTLLLGLIHAFVPVDQCSISIIYTLNITEAIEDH